MFDPRLLLVERPPRAGGPRCHLTLREKVSARPGLRRPACARRRGIGRAGGSAARFQPAFGASLDRRLAEIDLYGAVPPVRISAAGDFGGAIGAAYLTPGARAAGDASATPKLSGEEERTSANTSAPDVPLCRSADHEDLC